MNACLSRPSVPAASAPRHRPAAGWQRLAAGLGMALLGCALAWPAAAQTLRWTSQGDAQTMDPHSQNELLTNSMNGHVNDEEICIALAAMWARLNVKVRVNAMPRATYFPKLEKQDTSLYMLGWGGSITDAETTLTPVMRTRGDKGVGYWNFGAVRNDKFDALAARSSVEPDPARREALIKEALTEWKNQVHTLPLHRQMIPWATRANLNVVHRADNWFEWQWVTIGR